MYIVDSEQIENVYNQIKDFEAYSFEGETIIDPAYDIGDVLIIEGKRIIYQGELEYSGKFKANIKSKLQAKTEQESMQTKENTTTKIRRVESLIDQESAKITQKIQEIDEQNQKISKVTQTVNELNSKISDIADITTSAENIHGIVNLENINQSEPIHIRIYPTTENISYLYPNNNLYPSGNLFLKVRTLRFNNTTTNEYWDYILPDNLLICDGVYDEFILDYDSQSCIINKRVGYDKNGNLYKLENEITIEYDYPKINLTDGNYKVSLLGYTNAYVQVRLMAQNIYTTQFATRAELNSEINQTANEIQLSVDEKLKTYPTTTEMNSAIKISANDITSTVSKQYATKGELNTAKSEIKQTTDSIVSTVSKKVGNDEICSKISQSADEILLKGNRIIIESDNFKLNKNGNITATEGIIGGFSLGKKQFTGNLDGIYNYNSFDIRMAMCIAMGWIYASSNLSSIYDYDDDGNINSADYLKIQKILLGVNNNTKKISGTLKINSEDSKNCIAIEKDGQTIVSLGTGGINTELINTENILCGYDIGSNLNGFTGVTINGHTGEINFIQGGSSNTIINYNEIITPKLTQTSRAEQKKNFEKMQNNALDIVKQIDIYKYNLKNEKDTDKKHIGFIIGDNYNYSKEVTSIDNQGVDNYSFTSLCCKAIQELIEQNSKLTQEMEKIQNEIKKIKGG